MFNIFLSSTNSFEGQQVDEKVIFVIRRHPFYIILKSILFIFLTLIPVIGIVLFSKYLFTNGSFILFCFLSSVWLMILWSAYFYELTMYVLDVWILTDKRVIDSRQKGFFSRVVSELHVSRIQDMSVNTTGVIQTFLNFGDLQVQTAGTEEKFIFKQIPNPNFVKDEISSVMVGKGN